MAEIKKIKIGLLKENPLNSERSMDYNEILNLQESIKEVGLLHPLTVYENGDAEGTFTILSGHKRYRALKELSGPGGHVQCNVIEKPMNQVRESEMMARANVHRSTPEEIAKEVAIVNSLWNTMPEERRTYWRDRFLEQFEKQYGTTVEYMNDPAEFKSRRFRPRLDYINQITGLNLSNRTLTKYLKKTLSDEGEGFEEKPKKEKKITVKNIKRAAESLTGLIDAYQYESGKPEYLVDLQAELDKTISALEFEKAL